MIERRRFLKILGACTVGPGLAACGDGATTLPPSGGAPGDGGQAPSDAAAGDDASATAKDPGAAGDVKDVPVGTVKALPDLPVILVRDGRGLYAMTSLCTHRSCDMRSRGTIGPSGIACTCHGSKFAVDGAVTVGPASSPLRHFAVAVKADGAIVVDITTVVAADVRAAVP